MKFRVDCVEQQPHIHSGKNATTIKPMMKLKTSWNTYIIPTVIMPETMLPLIDDPLWYRKYP